MHLAAMHGDLEALRALAERHPNLLQRRAGCSLRTPCVAAIKAGQLMAARWLWRRGDDSHGSALPPGKLLGFAARTGDPVMLAWVLTLERPPADSETLFRLWGLVLPVSRQCQQL